MMCANENSSSADEIEITPEMIRSGVEYYYRGDLRFDTAEEIVAAIYKAMSSIRLSTALSADRHQR